MVTMVTCMASPGGNNSVVECDLAKVEVAGSNPVSRSINYSRGPRALIADDEECRLVTKRARLVERCRADHQAR